MTRRYFLPFYAILRSIPNKAGGIITMGGAIAVLFLIPFNNTSDIRNTTYRPIFKVFYWTLISSWIVLTWLGQCPVECEVLSFPTLGLIDYGKTVTIKSLRTHSKYSRRVKRRYSGIIDIFSIGKRTSTMISLRARAGNKIRNLSETEWYHHGKSFRRLKWLFLVLYFCSFARYDVVRSQDLGGSKDFKTCLLELFNLINYLFFKVELKHLKKASLGWLKKDCKVGFGYLKTRLRRYGKLRSLSGFGMNVVLLPSMKRGFSSKRDLKFGSLNKCKGKFNNLVEVIADVNFLQGAYQFIKSKPGMMTKGSNNETLDGLDEKWFLKTAETSGLRREPNGPHFSIALPGDVR